jgi:hypothetical protein
LWHTASWRVRVPTLRRVPRHRFFSQLQKERSGGSARELAVCGRRCGPFRSHGFLKTPAGPMGDVGVALGGVAADGWKVGAALLAKNVGGGINYIAVCETLNVSPSVVAAGLTIDNVGALAYFPLVSFLADKLPRCAPTLTTLTGASRGFFGMRAARAHIRNVQQRRYPSVHSQTHADGSISFSRVPRRETMASLTVEPHPAVCAESGG